MLAVRSKLCVFLSALVLAAILTGGCLGLQPAPTPTPTNGGTNGGTQLQPGPVEADTLALVNQRRVAEGGTALRSAADLLAVARAYSERMAREGFFSHTDPENNGPGDRVTAAGIAWQAVGENLAQNQGYQDPARAAAEGWFNSPGHFANIVNPQFEETAVGVAVADDGTYYFTQLFLTRP